MEIFAFLIPAVLITIVNGKLNCSSVDSLTLSCREQSPFKDDVALNVLGFNARNIWILQLRNVSGKITNTTLSNLPNIYTLYIGFSDIEQFTPTLKPLKSLEIDHSSFPKVTNDLLKQCCENIVSLTLRQNRNSGIEKGAFKGLNKLTVLEIESENITHLSKDFFNGTNSLETVRLIKTNIEEIEENTFQDMNYLRELDLSDNKISSFRSKLFTDLKKLIRLNLSKNDIKQFDLDLVPEQNSLKRMHFPTKSLSAMDVQTFRNTFDNLIYVYFIPEQGDCQLDAFCKKKPEEGSSECDEIWTKAQLFQKENITTICVSD